MVPLVPKRVALILVHQITTVTRHLEAPGSLVVGPLVDTAGLDHITMDRLDVVVCSPN